MSSLQAKVSRRRFLLGATVGTAVTAAALVVGNKPGAVQSRDEGEGEGARTTRGYQLTDHVRNYYRTARI